MNNIYLIYGSNYSLIKKELDKIIDGKSDVVKYDLNISNVSELLDDACCMSLFEESKTIIGQNALFLTNEKTSINHDIEYLSNYLNDDNHNNIIIFTIISDKLDERKKIVKLVKEKANVIHKESIVTKNLPSFVVKEFKDNGYSISISDSNYFINLVGSNIDIIISEINKLILYKDGEKNINKKDIDNISSKAFKEDSFDLTNAIVKKDYKRIFESYNELLELNEEPIKIIALLESQFALIYEVKMLAKHKKSDQEISNILNVHPYRIKLALECDYFDYEAANILKSLHDLDYKIKSGKIDKYNGLQMFLLSL